MTTLARDYFPVVAMATLALHNLLRLKPRDSNTLKGIAIDYNWSM